MWQIRKQRWFRHKQPQPPAMKEPSSVPYVSKAEVHISIGMEDDPRTALPSSPAEDLMPVLPQSNLNTLRQQ